VGRLYRRNGWWHARAWRGGIEYRERLGTKDRSVAEGAFRDWLDKIDRQSKGQAARKSFTEAAVRFVDEHLTTIRATTAKRYGAMLKNLSAHLGGRFLDEITEATLSDYELRRRREGIAVPTILLEFRCLSSLLSSCKHWGWIIANIVPPYLNARSRRGLKPGAPRTRYLTEDEERRLLEDGEPSREMRAAIIVAIDTGLRSEELYSLQHEQIDAERGVIRTTTNTKSGRARVVPLPPRSRAAIASLPDTTASRTYSSIRKPGSATLITNDSDLPPRLLVPRSTILNSMTCDARQAAAGCNVTVVKWAKCRPCSVTHRSRSLSGTMPSSRLRRSL
jgi:integrase